MRRHEVASSTSSIDVTDVLHAFMTRMGLFVLKATGPYCKR
jgi:hypothetical protein